MTLKDEQAGSYGGVLVNSAGQVLLREPTNHFGGYVWTFAKGRIDEGETPREAALREVREETGYSARIVASIPGVFKGTTGSTAMYLMAPEGEPAKPSWETNAIRWVSFDEARALIALTQAEEGRKRDLAILAAAEKLLVR